MTHTNRERLIPLFLHYLVRWVLRGCCTWHTVPVQFSQEFHTLLKVIQDVVVLLVRVLHPFHVGHQLIPALIDPLDTVSEVVHRWHKVLEL